MPERLSPDVREFLWNDPFGLDVYPRRNNPPSPTRDGRSVALILLKRYLADLTFNRPGACEEDDPIRFQIPESHIHVEWPAPEVELKLPAIALLAQAPGSYESRGMTTYVDESTHDVFAPKTVVNIMGEYVEQFVLEIWSETKAHRRSMLVGIEQALSPFQQMAGLRFVMKDYFGQFACLSLQSREIVDDEDAVRIRRRARMVIELRFNVVSLVNVETLTPETTVGVDAWDNGEAVEEDAEPSGTNCPDDC